jgi:sec-independent protein translocase protein TatC
MAIITDIDETRAPLLEHLVELRKRLLYSLVFVAFAFVICFYFSREIYDFIGNPIQKALGANARLISTDITGQFVVRAKLALTVALMASFPVLANQIWLFVAPGLYKHEKKAALPFLVMTPVLFTMGAALAYYMMPVAIKFLLVGFGLNGESTGGIKVETTPDVQRYFDFVLQMTFAFGLSFLLPVLLMLLERVGILSLKQLVDGRRYAIVITLVIAAIVTPPDITSQVMLWIPLVMLYELSIIAIRLTRKSEAKDKVLQEKSEAEQEAASTSPAE